MFDSPGVRPTREEDMDRTVSSVIGVSSGKKTEKLKHLTSYMITKTKTKTKNEISFT